MFGICSCCEVVKWGRGWGMYSLQLAELIQLPRGRLLLLPLCHLLSRYLRWMSSQLSQCKMLVSLSPAGQSRRSWPVHTAPPFCICICAAYQHWQLLKARAGALCMCRGNWNCHNLWQILAASRCCMWEGGGRGADTQGTPEVSFNCRQ